MNRTLFVKAMKTTVATAVMLTLTSACQPPPPPVTLSVTTETAGADALPGDGVCEATPGAGDCTLDAAFSEGNEHPSASITVPAGTYSGFDLVVTGNLQLNWGSPAAVVLADTNLSVEAGGGLSADGLRSTPLGVGGSAPVTASVAGTLHLKRSVINDDSESNPPNYTVTIASGGGVVLDRSVIVGWYGAVRNAGNLVAVQSSLFSLAATPRLITEVGGESHLQGTYLSRLVNTGVIAESCAGTVPVSLGGNAFQATPNSGCGPIASDRTFFTPAITYVSGIPAPATTTVGVDLSPLGQNGCQAGSDLLGNPRVVDGDGNGVAACDAGAVELQN